MCVCVCVYVCVCVCVCVCCTFCVQTSYLIGRLCRCHGLGANDAIAKSHLPKEKIVAHDFSLGPWWPDKTYDLAWCIEVLEHVARPYMANYQVSCLHVFQPILCRGNEHGFSPATSCTHMYTVPHSHMSHTFLCVCFLRLVFPLLCVNIHSLFSRDKTLEFCTIFNTTWAHSTCVPIGHFSQVGHHYCFSLDVGWPSSRGGSSRFLVDHPNGDAGEVVTHRWACDSFLHCSF